MKRNARLAIQPRTVVAAVMLGAALTMANASAQASESGDKAVNDIQRYCAACWRNARLHPDSWPDCTQEVFSRLLERLPMASWNRVLVLESDERREFVRAIDAVKKRTQRARKWAPLNEELAESRRRDLREERDVVQRVARDVLSDRQQSILQMSFEGYSVQEVADRLAMSPERVSDEKYKAIRKLRTHLGIDAV
ncbi:MAG: sigma-70 family RNA polymerase sigma factor [Gemmataceae bacterium]